jgi:hypothetical protein
VTSTIDTDQSPVSPLPELAHRHTVRMDLRCAIGVLMGNRHLPRRLAAEAGVPPGG